MTTSEETKKLVVDLDERIRTADEELQRLRAAYAALTEEETPSFIPINNESRAEARHATTVSSKPKRKEPRPVKESSATMKADWPSAEEKKVHWTQRPGAKKKMAERNRKMWETRRANAAETEAA